MISFSPYPDSTQSYLKSRTVEKENSCNFFFLIEAKKVVSFKTGLNSYFRSAQKSESFLRIHIRKYTDKPDIQIYLICRKICKDKYYRRKR